MAQSEDDVDREQAPLVLIGDRSAADFGASDVPAWTIPRGHWDVGLPNFRKLPAVVRSADALNRWLGHIAAVSVCVTGTLGPSAIPVPLTRMPARGANRTPMPTAPDCNLSTELGWTVSGDASWPARWGAWPTRSLCTSA